MLADGGGIKQEKKDPIVDQIEQKLAEVKKQKVMLAKKYDKLKELP